MKRLHQLCEDTARKAINELRLMHRRFSLTHHYLKLDDINITSNKKERVGYRRIANRNLFWSLTLGDTFVTDFMVNSPADERATTINKAMLLSKRSVDRSVDDEAAEKLEKSALTVVQTSTLAPASSTSIDTQFFSIGKTEPIKPTAIDNFDLQANTNETVSWKNVESYLQETKENEENEHQCKGFPTESEQFFSDDEEEKKSCSFSSGSSDKDELESEEKNVDVIETNNEYDFANSLLTLNSQLNQPQYYLYKRNLLSLSLATSSTALFYRTLAEIKFSSTIGERLTQMAEFNFEATLRRLINNHYVLLPHLFYSILKGKYLLKSYQIL